nr:hypothetical protein [uncultured Methanoregula sp.]
MLYETLFLLALITTWIIEIIILVTLIRLVFHDRSLSTGKIIITGALCTALTLPYLWFVLPPFVDAALYPLIGETFVVVIEAGILYLVLELDPKRAMICSLVMNAASYVLGFYLL